MKSKKLIKCCLGMIAVTVCSGCTHTPPSIIQVGECEHGIVHGRNINDVQKIWPEAKQTDVLISGGCYQDKFIKKR